MCNLAHATSFIWYFSFVISTEDNPMTYYLNNILGLITMSVKLNKIVFDLILTNGVNGRHKQMVLY